MCTINDKSSDTLYLPYCQHEKTKANSELILLTSSACVAKD